MTDQRSPELDDEDLETAYAGLLSASDQPTDLLAGVRARVAKRRRARQARVAVAVAACVAVVIGAVSVQLIPTDEPVVAGAPATAAAPKSTESESAQGPAPTPATTPTTTRTGPIPMGPATECFAPEDRPDLDDTEWAVDATVSKVTLGGETARVTLTVHHWYRGGSGEQVEATVPGPDVADNVPEAFGIGTRVLMSGGRDGRAHSGWPCGFSRYYDAKTAAKWEQAFR